jgi:hypothetical protein
MMLLYGICRMPHLTCLHMILFYEFCIIPSTFRIYVDVCRSYFHNAFRALIHILGFSQTSVHIHVNMTYSQSLSLGDCQLSFATFHLASL